VTFNKENFVLMVSGDDSIDLLLRCSINIERIVNDILESIHEKNEHISIQVIFISPRLNLLAAFGLDAALLKTLRRFIILRNSFAHYTAGHPNKLDEDLFKPVLNSLNKQLFKKYLEHKVAVKEWGHSKDGIQLIFHAFHSFIICELSLEKDRLRKLL